MSVFPKLVVSSALLFCLAVTPLASAEEVRIKLFVVPSSARVTVEPAGLKAPSSAPFMLNLPESSSDPIQMTLEAEGYQPLVLQFTPDELRKTERLPAEGVYALKKPFPLWILGLLLPMGAAAWWIGRSRGSKKSSNTANPTMPASPYAIENELAEGGMARVFQGTAAKAPAGEKVAIKIVRPELLEDSDTKKRFAREIEICARLDHPHLIRIYDSGVNLDGEMYLVMELLEGETLEERLDDGPELPKDQISRIILPLCQALNYCHERNLVHRDVKPSNIFLDRRAGVKLVDLGIARGLDFEAVTRTGMAVGSPHYMAPEQAKGEVRPENDQYSVGVLLFEMLTGERPFDGDDPIAVITQHLTAPIPSLSSLAPDAGPLLEAVVHRLLAKNPESRFASIAEASAAIESALREPDWDTDTTCGVAIPTS